ncbi:MAG: hypothetical protein LBC74_03540 [Planctomycetaceae bacterium]|jgi:hypothetical protein|nr:hypothetical protein [Planctomycetaceae bacterium]
MLGKEQRGHDLEILKKKIEEICISLNNHITLIDYDIITKDDFINRACKILSEYGKRGRYFNLDVILGQDQQFNPKEEWEKLETQIYQEIYQLIRNNIPSEVTTSESIATAIKLLNHLINIRDIGKLKCIGPYSKYPYNGYFQVETE